MHLKNKRPVSRAASMVWPRLDQLSKAALIDLYAQALAAQLGRADEPLTQEDLDDDAVPMLHLRGDAVPSSWSGPLVAPNVQDGPRTIDVVPSGSKKKPTFTPRCTCGWVGFACLSVAAADGWGKEHVKGCE